MKKNILYLIPALLLGVLTGCDTNTSSGVTSSTASNGGSNTSQTTSFQPVTSVEETYVIVTKSYVGLTITPSKTKAKKGETITLTLELQSGYKLKKLFLNDSTNGLTKTSDTTYTFVMPDESAVITAELSIEGDVVIQGSLAFALNLDSTTGIYSAKGVEVKDTAYLTYVVQGVSQSVLAIDNTKCFADISLATAQNGSFGLAGNAKYDFFYDPNNGDTPCYIVRTEVLNAPASANDVKSLFSGSVRAEDTTFPQNVNKVTYSNSATGDEYVWEDYENGSLATSVKTNSNKTKTTSHVFKQISKDASTNKNVYTVVDNYVEGANGNNDSTRLDDSKAFSGKYDIVSEYSAGLKKYQFLDHSPNPTEDAYFDAHHYSHDINSLDFDIHYGYRTGFDSTYNSTLLDFDVKVSSVTNEDGSFTTTIKSFKSYDESKDASLSSTAQYHYEYLTVLTFTKAGAPLNGSYKETYYGKDAYDVTKGEFLTGGENLGTVKKEVHFAYGYGEAKKEAISFDTTPYFISRLDNLKVTNSSTKAENTVQQNDTVNDFVSFTAFPETALDAWQYGITKSSNTSIIGSKSATDPFTFKAYGVGQSKLTFSNHTLSSGISQDINVNVVTTYKVDGLYLQAFGAYSDDEITANTAYVNAGFIKKAHIYATSRNTGKYANEFKCNISATSSNPDLLSVIIDNDEQTITFDAKKATVKEATKVTVTCTTDTNDTGFTGLTITVTIMPYTKPAKTLFTTWTDNDGISLTLKQYVEGDTTTYSTLVVDNKSYTFAFVYNEQTGAFNTSSNSGLDVILLSYDYVEDQMGVFAVSEGSWEGLDSVTSGETLCGSGTYDDEAGEYQVEKYYFLDRK